jgi:hypothetical protein
MRLSEELSDQIVVTLRAHLPPSVVLSRRRATLKLSFPDDDNTIYLSGAFKSSFLHMVSRKGKAIFCMESTIKICSRALLSTGSWWVGDLTPPFQMSRTVGDGAATIYLRDQKGVTIQFGPVRDEVFR